MNVWAAATMAFAGLLLGVFLGALGMHEMMDRAFRDYLHERQKKVVELAEERGQAENSP